MISVKNLKMRFLSNWGLKIEALKGVSFEIQENEVVGYLGPNGAGKTTTIKILTGLNVPTSGEVTIFGESVQNTKGKKNIGYLPEGPYFYEHLTATESLYFYASLFGFKKKKIRNLVEELIERFGLSHAKNRALKTYSKGMRQRLGFAQCLINDPQVIILDEPMSGLDPIGRQEIRDAILEEKKNGKTILMSSHILNDVEAICSRIILINQGIIIEDKPIIELLQSTKKETEIGFTAKDDNWQKIFQNQDYTTLSNEASMIRISLEPAVEVSAIIEKLIQNGCNVHSVVPKNENLEEYFMRVSK